MTVTEVSVSRGLDREAVRRANPLEEVIPALTGEPASGTGTERRFRCLFHAPDNHPSSRVNVAKQQWFCDVCRIGGDVFDLVQKHINGDFIDAMKFLANRAGLTSAAHVVTDRTSASYDYRDAEGRLLFQVRRLTGASGKKTFRQRRADGHGGWVDGRGAMEGVGRVVYRLSELRGRSTVYIAEGEKCVEALWAINVPATTNAGGAGKWNRGPFHEGRPYAVQLQTAGVRQVVVLPDNDDVGRRHGEDVAHACQAVGLTVKVVQLTDLSPKGDIVDYLRDHTKADLNGLVKATPLWGHPETVPVTSADGATLLDDLTGFVRRYVVLSPTQLLVVVLWVVHCHAFTAAETTPYLSITSATKQAGKTRLLEVLELVVPAPWLTGRATAAVLVRRIEQEHPTLLLDESDAAFKMESEYAEALRAILNSGYRQSGRTSLCLNSGSSYKDFSTFCAKAIAGIGRLPDTVADRSVPIRLKRRSPSEQVERFRERDARRQAEPLRAAVASWAAGNVDELRAARPTIPPPLGDRAADVCEPLLAIAEAVGGGWSDRARHAVVALCEGRSDEQALGVQLLADIRAVFQELDDDAVFSGDLVDALATMEDRPWAEYRQGKPLTKNGLARLLKAFEIHPAGTIRIGTETGRGYRRVSFDDAWSRYLPCQPSQRNKLNENGAQLNIDNRHTTVTEDTSLSPHLLANTRGSCDVTVERLQPALDGGSDHVDDDDHVDF